MKNPTSRSWSINEIYLNQAERRCDPLTLTLSLRCCRSRWGSPERTYTYFWRCKHSHVPDRISQDLIAPANSVLKSGLGSAPNRTIFSSGRSPSDGMSKVIGIPAYQERPIPAAVLPKSNEISSASPRVAANRFQMKGESADTNSLFFDAQARA